MTFKIHAIFYLEKDMSDPILIIKEDNEHDALLSDQEHVPNIRTYVDSIRKFKTWYEICKGFSQ